jgi:urease accessory protein
MARMILTPIMVIIPVTITTVLTTTGMNIAARITITIATTVTVMPPKSERGAFAELPLFLWLSPTFPVGSFAYSHGLEWAVEAGDVVDAASLRDWLEDLLNYGAPRSDSILLALAFHAVAAERWAELSEINELAIALAGSAERRMETLAQGGAFLAALRGAWSCPALERWPEGAGQSVAYPVAVGLAAAGHGLELGPCLEAFVLSAIANLVSAVVRLGSIGQSDSQKIIASLVVEIQRVARQAAGAGRDDLGGCALRSDLAAIKHETQYSRLFRS